MVCRLRVCNAEDKELKKKKVKGKVAGWSTEKMEEKANNQLDKNTEEMVSWRSTNQEEIDEVWKTLAPKIEKNCWEKTKWRIAEEVFF